PSRPPYPGTERWRKPRGSFTARRPSEGTRIPGSPATRPRGRRAIARVVSGWHRPDSSMYRGPSCEGRASFLPIDTEAVRDQDPLCAAAAPFLPSAVRVDFGRCAIVLFSLAALCAFLMFFLAALRCFSVAIS